MKPTQLIILFLFCVSATISAARPDHFTGSVYSEVIKGRSADKIWPLFEDFCNLFEIFPIDVSFCTLPITTPLSRYLSSRVPVVPPKKGIEGIAITWERQQVVEMNPKKRFLKYETLENNQGIKSYIATVSILEHKDGSQIKWDFDLDVEGFTLDGVKNNLKSILAASLVKIEAKLSKPTP